MKRLVSLGATLLGVLVASRGATEVEPRVPGVIDLHVDLSYQLNYKGRPFDRGTGQVVAGGLLAHGVAGVLLPLYVPRDVSPQGPRMQDLEASYERVLSAIGETPPYASPGCRYEPGRVRTWLAFEGAGPLADHPEDVERWVARGVRSFGLVHAYDNELASSSGSPGPHAFGLTAAGREVTRRVFAAGAVVDVSHASDRATAEILDLADAEGGTVMATHSNARRLAPHPRNLEDADIRRIAKTGGVVGVNFHSRFLLGGPGRAALSDVVNQVRHLVRVAGVDHVAIGSDFEGGIRPPEGLADTRGFAALSDALVAAGLSRADVARVFQRNALRVLCTLRAH